MKLIDIIRADQDRYTDINVDVNINHGWVSIDDSTGYSESIFLQGMMQRNLSIKQRFYGMNWGM